MKTETSFVTNKIHKDSTFAFEGVTFPNPLPPSCEKRKTANNWSPPSKKQYYKLFIVFILFAKILWLGLVLILLQPLEHHAIWLENMLEVSKNFNYPFGAGIFFLILAHSIYKMWKTQESKKVALWNKRHFEEKKTESVQHV